MIYLLDTDICIHWLRGNLRVHGQFAAIGPQAIAVSTITLAELHYGASSSARADENHAAIDDFVSALTVIDVTSSVARRFGEIKATLRAIGKLIEDFDLMLAATAVEHGLCLVSNNIAHFERISDLRLENWIRS